MHQLDLNATNSTGDSQCGIFCSGAGQCLAMIFKLHGLQFDVMKVPGILSRVVGSHIGTLKPAATEEFLNKVLGFWLG